MKDKQKRKKRIKCTKCNDTGFDIDYKDKNGVHVIRKCVCKGDSFMQDYYRVHACL